MPKSSPSPEPHECITEQQLQKMADGKATSAEIAALKNKSQGDCVLCRRTWVIFWSSQPGD